MSQKVLLGSVRVNYQHYSLHNYGIIRIITSGSWKVLLCKTLPPSNALFASADLLRFTLGNSAKRMGLRLGNVTLAAGDLLEYTVNTQV